VILGIDHVVLTVRDPEAAAAFYARVLDLPVVRFGRGRIALQAGRQKINLQPLGAETRNHACIGSGDLCLLTGHPPQAVVTRLRDQGVEVVEGPVTKTGALGPFTSVYFRDPDGNLIELSRYPDAPGQGEPT
jgi:catechol 2,3-dioxygenase-like lactoylglutathione lyase family enzyme